jgi:hypothetical protein
MGGGIMTAVPGIALIATAAPWGWRIMEATAAAAAAADGADTVTVVVVPPPEVAAEGLRGGRCMW